MIDKNNLFFKEYERICAEWKKAKNEREAEKKRMLNTFGVDSNEFKTWCEENLSEEKIGKFPFPPGTNKAYSAWAASVRYKENEVVMTDLLWKHEITNFVETLRKAGISTFVYADQSSGSIDVMHELVAAGCTIDSLCTITRNHADYEYTEELNGIRFFINAETKPCELCSKLSAGDTLYSMSSWEEGMEFDKIHDIKYCPLCGRPLTKG